MGYAECGADLARGDERGGRLVTGDLARRDAEGYYYIVGRSARFLKIYGNRVNLDEVEQLLKTQWPEMDCVCAGVDDKLSIFITAPALADDVRRHISHLTRINPSALAVHVLSEIPKSTSGKTSYQKLNDYLAASSATPLE
jgi:acyl-coenzyme A synthetase/AMP-(fatty) acid ligase